MSHSSGECSGCLDWLGSVPLHVECVLLGMTPETTSCDNPHVRSSRGPTQGDGGIVASEGRRQSEQEEQSGQKNASGHQNTGGGESAQGSFLKDPVGRWPTKPQDVEMARSP
jgi:hypothetical protein